MRSERHDQALAALKKEHDSRIDALNEESKQQVEALIRKHDFELQSLHDDMIARHSAEIEKIKAIKDEETLRAVEECRIHLEEVHNSRMSSVMSRNQEQMMALSEAHRAEMRERVSMIAQQKDELAEGDKQLALKMEKGHWEAMLERQRCQLEMELRAQFEEELSSVRRECETSLRELASEHFQERKRSNAEVLESAIKMEQEKAERKLASLRDSLSAEHVSDIESLKIAFEKELVFY